MKALTKRRSDKVFVTETCGAPSANGKARRGDLSSETEPQAASPAAVCTELQSLQRRRVVIIKSRIMQANRLQAIVAGTIGYHAGMEEADRRKKFIEATAVIKKVLAGNLSHPLADIIKTTQIGIDAFDGLQASIPIWMVRQASKLPVAGWVGEEKQRGFGLQSLATLVGECGNLANYANPGKLWRRMGMAPWIFDGKTLMGSTWRREKLPAAEWEQFGYSPRRRAIAFVFGEGIVKQNHSVYRARYDETKALIKKSHPDFSDLRCHRHGMLLATKMLLRDLWIQWRK